MYYIGRYSGTKVPTYIILYIDVFISNFKTSCLKFYYPKLNLLILNLF